MKTPIRLKQFAWMPVLAGWAMVSGGCPSDGNGTVVWKGRAFQVTYSQQGVLQPPAPLPEGTLCKARLELRELTDANTVADYPAPSVVEQNLYIGKQGEFSVSETVIVGENLQKVGGLATLNLNCGGGYTSKGEFKFLENPAADAGYSKSQVHLTDNFSKAELKLEKWKTVSKRLAVLKPVSEFQDSAEALKALMTVDQSPGSVYFLVNQD